MIWAPPGSGLPGDPTLQRSPDDPDIRLTTPRPPDALRRGRFWQHRRVRVMYPGEFQAILRRHRNPRFYTCGIDRNRWGERVREAHGMPPSGTIWFAKVSDVVAGLHHAKDPHRIRESGKDDRNVVPANCLPYSTIATMAWSEHEKRWTDGEVVPGWRSVLHDLVKSGHLRPSVALSRLIAEDTHALYKEGAWGEEEL